MKNKILNVVNKKGGVGKSTSVAIISQILVYSGYRVLAVDSDPSSNLSTMLGVDGDLSQEEYYELICKKITDKEVMESFVFDTPLEGLDFIPSSKELSRFNDYVYDLSKDKKTDPMLNLKHNLNLLADDYDYIIIDSIPTENHLSDMFLCASDMILCPINSDNLSHQGLVILFDKIQMLHEVYNIDTQIGGVFITRFEPLERNSKDVRNAFKEQYGNFFTDVCISKSTYVMRMNTQFEPIINLDKKHKSMYEYMQLIRKLGLIDAPHQHKFNTFVDKYDRITGRGRK